MRASDIIDLLKQTWIEFNEDNAPRLGAALAYYTVFSLAPMLVIAVAIVGFFLNSQDSARAQIIGQFGSVLGPQGAEAVRGMIENAREPGTGMMATIISIATLIFGASGVFGELESSLNIIWGVQHKDGNLLDTIKDRFMSFTLVVGVGFLLLVSLLVTTLLNVVGDFFTQSLPGGALLWQIINFVISFCIITGLFAAIFKVVPDVDVHWQDVWIGAAFTALLFVIGRWALGRFLITGSTTSIYGAAGSLAAVLLWVYYSAQILFLGAEFTQVYANRFGTTIVPSRHAIPLTAVMRAKQGLGFSSSADVQVVDSAAPQPPAPAPPVTLKQGIVAGLMVGLLIGISSIRNRRRGSETGNARRER